MPHLFLLSSSVGSKPGDVDSRLVTRGWILATIVAAASVFSYLDRAILGVVIPVVRRELVLDAVDYGIVLNTFLASYSVFYIVGGRLADRLGYRRMFPLCVAWWCFASVGHAFIQSRTGLIFTRGLLGIGEGGYFPTAMRALTEWFEPARRAKAIALLLCGSSLGMVITPPLVAWITLHTGWRGAFIITGGVGLLLVPIWAWFWRWSGIRPSPHTESGISTKGSAHEQDTLFTAFCRRKFWCLLIARALTDAVWFFYVFWLPSYLQDARGYSLTRAGLLLAIPYICADAGAIMGAWASSILIKRGLSVTRSRTAIWVLSVLIFWCGTYAYFVASRSLALVLISLGLFGHMSWGTNLQTAITEASPERHVGALFGITGAAGTAAGAIAQLAFGYIVRGGSYGPAFFTCAVLYGIALISALISAASPVKRTVLV